MDDKEKIRQQTMNNMITQKRELAMQTAVCDQMIENCVNADTTETSDNVYRPVHSKYPTPIVNMPGRITYIRDTAHRFVFTFVKIEIAMMHLKTIDSDFTSSVFCDLFTCEEAQRKANAGSLTRVLKNTGVIKTALGYERKYVKCQPKFNAAIKNMKAFLIEVQLMY